jgi:hypothetical protein
MQFGTMKHRPWASGVGVANGVALGGGVGCAAGSSNPSVAKACPSGSTTVTPTICTRTGPSERIGIGRAASTKARPPLISNKKVNGCGVNAAPSGETTASMINWLPVLLTKLPSASVTPFRSRRTRGAGPEAGRKRGALLPRRAAERPGSVAVGRLPIATFPESKVSAETLPTGTIKSPATPPVNDTGNSNERRKIPGAGPANTSRAAAIMRPSPTRTVPPRTHDSRLFLSMFISAAEDYTP